MLSDKTSVFALTALVSLLISASAHAEIKTQELEYKQGATVLQGFVAWDDAVKGKRPGVLIVHEWWGHNDHARAQAKRIAEAGYVAFALDMFGKGKVATHPTDAKAFVAEATADPKLEKARFDAALAQLKKRPEVNPQQIGAVGYCFGGAVALDMARMGSPLGFVATFHGALTAKTPAKKGFKPRVLVLNGADDPMVPKAQVDAFKAEMTAAGARFEVIDYPGAKHAFTNPEADKRGIPGLAYNAKVDQESFDAFRTMLVELYGAPKTAAAATATTRAAAKPAAAATTAQGAPAASGAAAAPGKPAATAAPAKSSAPATTATPAAPAKSAAPAATATPAKSAAPAATATPPKPAAPATPAKPAAGAATATPPKPTAPAKPETAKPPTAKPETAQP